MELQTTHKGFWEILFVFITGAILVAAVLLYSPPSSAAPAVAWSPPSVTEEIDAGDSHTVTASFTASKTLTDVVVRVVPALAPYVSVNPIAFGDVTKGETHDLAITIAAPVDAEPGTFDGTIQLRSGSGSNKTYAKPLAVTILLGLKYFEDTEVGIKFTYPTFGVPTKVTIVQRDRGIQSINITYQSELTDSFVSYFNFALIPNNNQLTIAEWFQQNIDLDGLLVASGAFEQRTFQNGIEGFVITDIPIPEAHGNRYGPVSAFYVISPSSNSIINGRVSQDNELELQGVSSPEAQNTLLLSILESMQLP